LPSMTTETDKHETVSSNVERETLLLSELRPKEADLQPDSNQFSRAISKDRRSSKVHTKVMHLPSKSYSIKAKAREQIMLN